MAKPVPQRQNAESLKDGLGRLVTEDRRLALLKLLRECPGRMINSEVLQAGVLLYGHAVSADRLRVDLAWLAEMGFVSLGERDNVLLAALTERGSDVASGSVQAPGVGLTATLQR